MFVFFSHFSVGALVNIAYYVVYFVAMPPKRKVTHKSKVVLPKPVDDSPVEDLPVSTMSNLTDRRPIVVNGTYTRRIKLTFV